MRQIMTTHGEIKECDLVRTLGFEERPDEFVVWIEYRIHEHGDCAVCCQPDLPHAQNGQVLVRRDAHVIKKDPSVVADAIAASIG